MIGKKPGNIFFLLIGLALLLLLPFNSAQAVPIITAHVTWIHENQDWKASFPLGNAANSSDDLNTFKLNLNHTYDNNTLYALVWLMI